MHDKSNSPKGQRTKMIVFLANWASEMHAYQPFEDVIEHLGDLKRAYLESDWADDRDQRKQILLLFDQLQELMSNLDNHDHEDFKDLDRFILKLTA